MKDDQELIPVPDPQHPPNKTLQLHLELQYYY